MKCVECPLTLSCCAGRLGITSSEVHTSHICPECGRFSFLIEYKVRHPQFLVGTDVTEFHRHRVYFKCEQRPLLPAWSAWYTKAAHKLTTLTTRDPVSDRPLQIMLCPICDAKIVGVRDGFVPSFVCDLDDVEGLKRFLDEMR